PARAELLEAPGHVPRQDPAGDLRLRVLHRRGGGHRREPAAVRVRLRQPAGVPGEEVVDAHGDAWRACVERTGCRLRPLGAPRPSLADYVGGAAATPRGVAVSEVCLEGCST